jgi:fucose permease
MIGRMVSGFLSRRVRAEAMVLASALLSLVAVAGLLLAPSQSFAVLAVALIGLGFATVFPTTLAQAGATFADFSGTAFSVIFVIALTGGMTSPWLVGKVAAANSIEAGFGVAIFNCAMIALLQGVIWLRHSAPQAGLSKT